MGRTKVRILRNILEKIIKFLFLAKRKDAEGREEKDEKIKELSVVKW